MASKVFQQICKFLDDKGLKYGTEGEGTNVERIYFAYRDLVEQKLLFSVNTLASVVQFRSVGILDEDDLENYRSKPENRIKLFEYLLKKNYEWKLGKFALDPEDPDVDLYFTISDYVEAEKGIEDNLLSRMFDMFFDPRLVQRDIKNIKSILATGEISDDYNGYTPHQVLDLAKKLAEKDPDFAKELAKIVSGIGDDKKPSDGDNFDDGI